MNKYPSLDGLSGAIAVMGWFAVVLGGVAMFFGLVGLFASTNAFAGVGASIALLGGGQSLLVGLLLAAAGGVIKVLIDIEANTSGRIQQSVAVDPVASSANALRTENSDPLPIPPQYELVGETSLKANEPVFDPRYGEGFVLGSGPQLALVHFVKAATSPTEIEKQSLYRRR